ncbi:hypothetical protein MRX96_038993 [Rhipicephalus microplus]
MDATEILEATGDLPRAVVAEPCAADKDEADYCAVAKTSERASKRDCAKNSGEKQAVPASGRAETRKGSLGSSADKEALDTEMTAKDVRGCTDAFIRPSIPKLRDKRENRLDVLSSSVTPSQVITACRKV